MRNSSDRTVVLIFCVKAFVRLLLLTFLHMRARHTVHLSIFYTLRLFFLPPSKLTLKVVRMYTRTRDRVVSRVKWLLHTLWPFLLLWTPWCTVNERTLFFFFFFFRTGFHLVFFAYDGTTTTIEWKWVLADRRLILKNPGYDSHRWPVLNLHLGEKYLSFTGPFNTNLNKVNNSIK